MLEILRTTCNRDCPDACTLEVGVKDGKAVKLKGAGDDPVTQGFLCERTARFLNRQYADDRLTTPLLRQQGELKPVGWEEALKVAAEKLLETREKYGAQSILHYRSGGSLGILKLLSDYLFENFGPVALKHGDICSGAGEAAQEKDFGVCDSSDIFDLYNSRTIIIWGKNVHTSNAHLVPVLIEAKRRGARLIGIDPVRTRIAGQCDLFLQPRPGADFSLAMAVARYLFEHDLVDPQAASYCDHLQEFRELAFSNTIEGWSEAADLDADQVRELARAYGENKPGAILVGWGMGRRANGARTVRALDALAAVSGNLGVAGGGSSFYFARRSAFDTSFIKGLEAAPRSFSEARLGLELLAADPRVRFIWVTAGNPVAMLPQAQAVRQAFEQTDFVVVVDTHPTDTTDLADLVLPTLTLLEDDDILGAYGNHYVRVSRPTVRPPGQARHELEIWQGLAARLGLEGLLDGSPRDWKRRLLKPGLTLEQLEEGPRRSPEAQPVLFADRKFATASGKVNLMTEPALPAPPTSAEFPYTLLAVSTPKAQSSQWSVDPPRRPQVSIAPRPDLASGQTARLRSALGAIEVEVVHDAGLRPDVVVMAKGGMQRHGWCANALVEARETDDGGGAAYYDQPVCLEPL